MRGRTGGIAAALSALALVAAGCGGGGGSEPEPATSQGGGTGGEISIRSCTPQNPLIPANTNEVCGGNLLDAIDAKLVHYNADTAAPELDIAESIETKDNQTFTVKLKPGYKFHDGTEVKAKNFVDAWNWNCVRPQRQSERLLLRADRRATPTLQCGTRFRGEADCEGKPAKAKEMSGLKVVDDHTFTIKTTDKVSNLPVRLGYTAFAPLPDSFFSDPKAYGEKPIGAGPFKLDSKTDTRDGRVEVRRLLRQVQAQRGQGDLPDLQRRQSRLQRRRREQPRLHRQHSDRSAHRRPLEAGTARPQRCAATPARSRYHYLLPHRRQLQRPPDAPGASRWRSIGT